MQTPVLAANWKMHHGPRATRSYLERFLTLCPVRADRTVVFFPPAVSLVAASEAVAGRPDVLVGVQNVHWEERGAFTGETSPLLAIEAGARAALVGHSERRALFGETDEATGRKCAAAIRAGLTPVLCVGERLEERERGETEPVVLRQLLAGVSRLAPAELATILVAYEPVWAIGTGRTARAEDASRVHAVIREKLAELIGPAASDIPILYGGSVTVENAPELLDAPGIDGLLVGGASLDPERWALLVEG
jgi:triosephosphate isomerase